MTVMTTATTALSSTAKAGLRLARPALIPARVGFNFYAGLLAPLARLLSRDTGTTLTEETPAGPRAVLDADRKDARLHSELHQAAEGVVPIKHYDELTATDAAVAVRTLTDTTEVQATGRHERANKNRKTVLTAVDERLAQLA